MIGVALDGPPSESHAPLASSQHVLLVDDDPIQLSLMRAHLRVAGFDVRTARTASEALETARKNRPDIVLSDIVMDELDGFALCSLFRCDPVLGGVPIVLVTASISGPSDSTLALASGASCLVERSPGFEREFDAMASVLASHASPLKRAAHSLPAPYVRRMASQLARLLETSHAARHELALSERKQERLEEQLRQAQKMEAIGQLTGGIAHDFNNLLAIIVGNSEILRESLAGNDPRRADTEAIIDAGQRGASLTGQLLAFGRRQAILPRTLDLNLIVQRVEQLICRVIGEDINLAVDLAPDPQWVRADACQLEQVILNLVVNARDAMPGGGSLLIRTGQVGIDRAPAEAGDAGLSGACVALSVTDTGCGMDPETQRSIFEPFFSTKTPGEGSGLGLANCHSIVEQNAGHISVRSEPGQGSTFTVYLPVATATPDAAVGEPPAPSEQLTGRETILLIEDDEAVRTTVRRMLTGRGYQVLEARTGDQALSIAMAHVGPVHLVLSDVVIPGSTGPDIVTRLRASNRPLKALFMSGHTDHALVRDIGGRGAVNLIQKPITSAVLSAKIREVLNA